MKRNIFLSALLGLLALQSCTHYDTYPTTVVKQVSSNAVLQPKPVTFSAANGFSILQTITPSIGNYDLVLVYLLDQVDQNSGNNIWRLLPQKYYYGSNLDEVYYNFDYTVNDVRIFMESKIDMTVLPPAWTNNQTFRIVIIPGYQSGKSVKDVDFRDYEATLKAYGINPYEVKKIN